MSSGITLPGLPALWPTAEQDALGGWKLPAVALFRCLQKAQSQILPRSHLPESVDQHRELGCGMGTVCSHPYEK